MTSSTPSTRRLLTVWQSPLDGAPRPRRDECFRRCNLCSLVGFHTGREDFEGPEQIETYYWC